MYNKEEQSIIYYRTSNESNNRTLKRNDKRKRKYINMY